MKKTLLLIFTATTILSCKNEDTPSSPSENPSLNKQVLDVEKAFGEIPKFSSPEIQKGVEEWFTAVKESFKELKEKSTEAGNDQEKIKQIGIEMAEKMRPWGEKISQLRSQMTPEDLKKLDEFAESVGKNMAK